MAEFERKKSPSQIKQNKWEGNPLVPITAFGMVAVVALGISGLINYGINSYHANKLEIPKESRSLRC